MLTDGAAALTERLLAVEEGLSRLCGDGEPGLYSTPVSMSVSLAGLRGTLLKLSLLLDLAASGTLREVSVFDLDLCG